MKTVTRKAAADPYFDRVREFPLRRIRSAADHSRAKRIYLRVSASNRDAGTRDYLDVLANLIADYENRAVQDRDLLKVNVADLVRHRMRERGISVTALAREIGVAQPNLSEMLKGRRDWSKAAIRSLSKIFNIRAERFLA